MARKKISSMSSYGPPRNYCKESNKYLIGHVIGGQNSRSILVLAGRDSTYLWQSFTHPTDTILPTQMLNQGSKLVARFLEVNHSSGKSMITLHTDQNLVPYTTDFSMDSINSYSESYKTRKF